MSTQPLRVGMIGYAFMGAVARPGVAERPPVLRPAPITPELTALAGRERDGGAGRGGAARLRARSRPTGGGWSSATTST